MRSLTRCHCCTICSRWDRIGRMGGWPTHSLTHSSPAGSHSKGSGGGASSSIPSDTLSTKDKQIDRWALRRSVSSTKTQSIPSAVGTSLHALRSLRVLVQKHHDTGGSCLSADRHVPLSLRMQGDEA